MIVFPSLNVTVPVVTALVRWVTVPVKMTVWFLFAGLRFDTSCAFVDAFATVWVTLPLLGP